MNDSSTEFVSESETTEQTFAYYGLGFPTCACGQCSDELVDDEGNIALGDMDAFGVWILSDCPKAG